MEQNGKNCKDFKIEKGNWYMCINNETPLGVVTYTKGKVYKCEKDNFLPNDYGGACSWTIDVQDYFRLATEDEIPHEPKKRHSKEGYMTDQEWKEYFEDKPTVCDNSIDCTEEEFKQIHTGKIR